MGVVIGITSAKGGTGKTLIATNLAAALGLGYHMETILIDLNPGLGNADLLLDLTPERSWGDLVPVLDELSTEHIRLAATKYRPGLDLLASPPDINHPQISSLPGLAQLIDFLRDEYDLIVIDFPTGINGSFSLAEIVIVLLTPDAPSLRSSYRFLAGNFFEGQKVGAVINQYSAGGVLKPSEIETYLGLPVWGVMPIDGNGTWSNICFGEPCALKRSSKLGRSVREFAARLLHMVGMKEE